MCSIEVTPVIATERLVLRGPVRGEVERRFGVSGGEAAAASGEESA